MVARCAALVAVSILILAPAVAAQDALSAATWDEALALSRQHDKPILIDFFTEW
ncbi:MAG: hypothetical protein RBT60_13875 [Candidatus Krumholzibacteria bacterium]|jgi:hypothetical protein|nr:hypothetical protein [Candidatus Krumholzibacteria bacterium]